MLVLALAIVLAPLAWLVIGRMQRGEPALRGGRRWVMVGLGVVLMLRVALAAPLPLRVALCLGALGAAAVWLRRHGNGGGGPGDDDDRPVDPGPDPDAGEPLTAPHERLDPDAFDRARADWEQALKKHD
jgi:hypothetical protein